MRLAPLAAAAALLIAALSLPARADLANGESILRNTCAACHGFPPLAGPDRAANNPQLIADAISFRVPQMSFLRGMFTFADYQDIAAYVAFLQNPPPPAAPDSYQGLWLKTPFESEAGWGINFTHAGNVLFATWFTYDTDGNGMWLVMTEGTSTAANPNQFTGTVYRTTAPGAFNSVPFRSIAFPDNFTQVGTLSVTFSNADNAVMSYTVNGVTQTKNLARYIYVANPPKCTLGGTPGATPNYQDLWWASPAGSENGWGLNVTHQGDILFGTWFTYQAGGKGMWLAMSALVKSGNGVYSGVIDRPTGPNAFSSTTPFNPQLVQHHVVGDATLSFSDANNGTFRYTLDGVTQTKNITRLLLGTPSTVCK